MAKNGDWAAMEKLVLSKITENSKKLDQLSKDMSRLSTQVAVLADREDREMLAAKSVAMKWATAIGAIVSAVITGAISWGRGH